MTASNLDIFVQVVPSGLTFRATSEDRVALLEERLERLFRVFPSTLKDFPPSDDEWSEKSDRSRRSRR